MSPKKVKEGICPLCGSPSFMSKTKMVSEILAMIGYPKEKSIYNDGTLSREEMAAVYNFIKRTKENR